MKTYSMNHLEPKWEEATRYHDWRNYISDELKSMWETFSTEQKEALMNNANEIANEERWD